MDIDMPVMDGITATKIIGSLPGLKNLPIIGFTANEDQGR
jgi:CheY-like chemotaxis protein